MDVVRVRRRPVAFRLAVAVLGALAAAGAAAWALPPLFSRATANEPTIARADVVVDTVTRGTIVRSVAAAGLMVPDRVHVVASVADGIVVALPVRAGAHVDADTVVARLDNPDLSAAVADASAQLDAARADLRAANEDASASRLDEEAQLRSARAEEARATAEARADVALHAQGLIGDLPYRSALIKSAEDHDLVTIARDKITVGAAGDAAKVAAAQARIDQIAADLAAKRAQVATLVVRAGAAGIVQSVAIDPGQRVSSGAEFARIADERDLKAVLQVAESDVRGLTPGLPVRVTTSDGTTAFGHVARIAPAAQNGTVAVDVAFERVPAGTRPDQNVDGTIVLGAFAHALSLARPAGASDAMRLALYRLDGAGTHAYRTSVTTASGSDERVRIVGGLAAGDRVIVSDTSTFDAPVLHIR